MYANNVRPAMCIAVTGLMLILVLRHSAPSAATYCSVALVLFHFCPRRHAVIYPLHGPAVAVTVMSADGQLGRSGH